MNIKIAPSILSADFANLERDIRKIDTADYVHVDIMDGEFVPNISIGIPVVKAIRPVTGLPLDVHLMITKPVRYVEQFCDAGADLVTVHVESDFPENIHAALEKIHAKGKRAGIVLKPNTRAEAALRRAESDLEVRGMEMNVSTAEAAQERARARIRAVALWRKNG